MTAVELKDAAGYRARLRGLVRGLWAGELTRNNFADLFTLEVQRGTRDAWREGAAAVGITEDELTEAERAARDQFWFDQQPHVFAFAAAIADRDRASGALLREHDPRLALWVNRYHQARELAKLLAGADLKYRWVLGPTRDHCSDCAKYAGRVYRGSIWQKYGIAPRSSVLACNGLLCRCSLEPTDEAATPGRPPAPSNKGIEKHLAGQHDQRTHGHRYTGGPAAAIGKQMTDDERAIVGLATHEVAIVYDADGNITFKKPGNASNVEFDDLEVKRLKDAAVMTHNHPSGRSFSPTDVRFAAMQNLGEMRAVGVNNAGEAFLYRMYPRPGGLAAAESARRGHWWSRSVVDARMNEYERAVKSEFTRRIDTGRLSVQDANRYHGHTVMKALAPDLHLVYERIPLNDAARDTTAAWDEGATVWKAVAPSDAATQTIRPTWTATQFAGDGPGGWTTRGVTIDAEFAEDVYK